ncbi:MAG TPA: circadian clock protein KaiC [Vicinamibacteria bacterium]
MDQLVSPAAVGIRKAATGIAGLDEITGGGLPAGRPTLVCGSAGCGKTLLAMEFLLRGAEQFGEPGVFVTFEETAAELTENVRSLGHDLKKLVAERKLAIDHVRVERAEIEETGDYDLEGLFVRLGHAIDSIRAKRVVIDTLEALFAGLSDHSALRAELRRLFRWLKDRGVTAIVTAERGAGGGMTRHGLEEYVSDCVVLLDHRVEHQVSTRRLRVVKYRGSFHGTNEYPFLIDEGGISVVPITSAGLNHPAGNDRVSSGIPRLDAMLDGQGFFRGSTILISGTAGTGKTSFASAFADAACRRGEKCLFFTFEESPAQIQRNMRSIGIELDRHISRGLLSFSSWRPSTHGLEMHLALVHKHIDEFAPDAVLLDPVTNFENAGGRSNSGLMLVRLIDLLKSRGITGFLTALVSGGEDIELTQTNISSIVDTWLSLKTIVSDGERNRGLYVLKSRGMAHSNQIREYRFGPRGIDIVDVYAGPEGVLTGSARLAQEARETAARLSRDQETARKLADLERRRSTMEHQVAAIRSDFEAYENEVQEMVSQRRATEEKLGRDRLSMGKMRGMDQEGRRPRGKNSRGGG